MMEFYKVILEIEKIVECDSQDRAVELARSDLCESDFYAGKNWHSYELTTEDMQAAHNLEMSVIK